MNLDTEMTISTLDNFNNEIDVFIVALKKSIKMLK